MKKWKYKGSLCPSCQKCVVIFGTKTVMCPGCKNEWKYDVKEN